jgi:hypothetical protein
MDIRNYLAEQGLTDEEINAVVGNEKTAKAMSSALTKYEEGTTALTRAAAEKKETTDFWEQKTQELQGSVNRLTAAEKKAATATAERARYAAYLQSLKEQGYDVPDDLVSAPAKQESEAPKYFTREDFEKGIRQTAPDLVSLTALSNEYYSLFGKPYVEVETDFTEAQKSGKSLRDFARSKYNFDGKKTELAAAADQKRIDDIVAEKMKTKEAELAAKYGSNPETRSPMPSKFDKLSKREGFKQDSWKSQEGRDASRNDRLKKFENIQIN